MINYPNGKKAVKEQSVKEKTLSTSLNAANRGMELEHDLNISNEYYREHNLAVITKRPTPIKIVKVDYSKGAKITEAYFEKQSTTDYNGVYRGKYLDFEAKSVNIKTRFPLANIFEHQFTHLRDVINHGGIAFFIIEFKAHDEVYLVDASNIIAAHQAGEKSIPYAKIKEKGHLISRKLAPRLDYLSIVDTLYFTE